MIRRHKSRTVHHLFVISILLLGAYLRWGAFDEAIIHGDQSAILDAAFQAAHLRYFPDIGMKSSVGVMQTGIVPLLAAVPLLVINRVIAVRWFFAALDFLALAWLYRAARRTLGRRTALLTSLLYATNPWIIEFVRTIWYQTLIAAFATVAFSGLLWVLSARKGRAAALALALIGATLMSLVHLVTAPWGMLVVAMGLLIAWHYKIWRGLWVGLGVSGVLVFPYLVYLVRTRFSDLAFLLRTGSDAVNGLNTSAFRLAGELLTGSMIVSTTHGDQWDRAIIEWPQEPTLFLILLGIAALWAFIDAGRRRRRLLGLSVAWSVLVPAIYLFSDVHLQHFYLMHIFPAPLILMAAGLDAMLRRVRVGFRLIGHSLVALLVVITLWWSSLWFVRIRLEAHGQLQRTTRAWLMDRAAITVDRYLEETPYGQVIVLTANRGEVSPFDWIRAYVQSDAVRVTPAGSGLIIPEGPMCYLLGPGVPVETLAPVADHITPTAAMTVPAAPSWNFHCGETRAPLPSPLATWNNGMRLLETQISGTFAPGEVLDLTYTWHYLPTVRRDYHVFNHLLLEGRTLVAQIDGAGVPTKYWRAGDVLITYFDLRLPENLSRGAYHLLTGAYAWPEIDRVFLTDGSPAFQVDRLTLP